jgi:hypothetical protein
MTEARDDPACRRPAERAASDKLLPDIGAKETANQGQHDLDGKARFRHMSPHGNRKTVAWTENGNGARRPPQEMTALM